MPRTKTGEQRRTVQQAAVRSALKDAGGFVSAQDLHQRLSQGVDSVGLATAYRQLNALAASGHADTIPVPGGQLFRDCSPGEHHHHLVCENCGRAVQIGPPSEEWIRTAADTHGFTVTRHVLEVFGRCADCSAA